MSYGKITAAELAGNQEVFVGNTGNVAGVFAAYLDLAQIEADSVIKVTSYKQILNDDGDDNYKPLSSVTLTQAEVTTAIFYPPPVKVEANRSYQVGVQLVSGTEFPILWEVGRL